MTTETTPTTPEKPDYARENARGWMDTINEYVAALECDYDRLEELRDQDERDEDEQTELIDLEAAAGEFKDAEESRERITESALEVSVRSDWHTPGEDSDPTDFRILLTFGGPALQIMGELDEHNEPSRAWLEYQDWGTPWTEYYGDNFDADALLTFALCFYFGE